MEYPISPPELIHSRRKKYGEPVPDTMAGFDDFSNLAEEREERGDALRKIFRDYFNKKFAEAQTMDIESIPNFTDLEKLEGWIAELVDEQESWSERLITEHYREGVKFFLAELIKFVKEKSGSDSPEEKIKLRNFNALAYELWFSSRTSRRNRVVRVSHSLRDTFISFYLLLMREKNKTAPIKGGFEIGACVYLIFC